MKSSFKKIFLLLVLIYFFLFYFDLVVGKNSMNKRTVLTAKDLILTNANNLTNEMRYVSAGQRSVIIGSQNGNFPPLGWHIADEMSGVWLPPLKALDGIWMRINGEWILPANKYIRKAAWSEFEFEKNDLSILRQDVALDEQPGALFIYHIKNNSHAQNIINIEIVVRIHPIITYPWAQRKEEYLQNADAFDFQTKVFFDSAMNRIRAITNKYRRFVTFKTSEVPEEINFEKRNDLPLKPSGSFCTHNEADVTMIFKLSLPPDGFHRLIFGVAGSIISNLEAAVTGEEIIKHADRLLFKKEQNYINLANNSSLITPDEEINKAFLWNKLNIAMQVLTSPGLGTGLVAGYPDYPFYFGNDGCFTVPGLLAIGQIETAKDHLRLLAKASNGINNSSGKIIHELVTDGSVHWGKNADFGNTNETCQFAKAVEQVWRWSGDDLFLKDLYPTVKQGMLDWLINDKIEKGDIFPIGYGNAEVIGWGPKRLDVQCYAVEGFIALAEMAAYLNDTVAAKTAKEWANKIKDGINQTWWLEDEGHYANSLTENNQPVLSGELSVTPLEAKIVPNDRAAIMFETIEKSEQNSQWGWGPMSISSSIMAMAQVNYDRIDQSLQYVRGIARYAQIEMPGGLPEHHPGDSLKKSDHVLWRTNTIQSWGSYGLHYPLVAKIAGIQPNAPHNKVSIMPHLPSEWDYLYLTNVKVSGSVLDLCIIKNNNVDGKIKKIQVSVALTSPLNLVIGANIPVSVQIKSVKLNGKELRNEEFSVRKAPSGQTVSINTDVLLSPAIFEVNYL